MAYMTHMTHMTHLTPYDPFDLYPLFSLTMSLFIASLNSGSNGNCYYIGNEDQALLVDAGLSCRETEKRMKKLGLNPSKVRAVFVSHEHSDHIRGVEMISKKWTIPVFINSETYKFSRLSLDKDLRRDFQPHSEITIGNLSVTAFPKFHDAADPCSFIITHNDTTVGVFTDIGKVCPELTKHFRLCDAAFLESNYDEKMLEEGNYPWHLKKRIRGGNGHLSNSEALEFYLEHKPAHLSHLLLSHLSKNNNCPELVQKMFEEHAGNTKIIVASRYEESMVYQVKAGKLSTIHSMESSSASQLELFASF
jgi:phosphoribosyl 1,2-cyclic phosphodiesterase